VSQPPRERLRGLALPPRLGDRPQLAEGGDGRTLVAGGDLVVEAQKQLDEAVVLGRLSA